MTLGIIGVGNMASAIINGVLSKGVFAHGEIIIYDTDKGKYLPFSGKGLVIASTAAELVDASDLILLAVKPQQIDDVISEITGLTGGKCIISIVTGISAEYYKSRLGKDTYIVRVMPNTPILLGCGASAVTPGRGIPRELFEKAVDLFSSSGEVVFVEEDKMNAVTCVNGSSPAYFFVMAEAMVSCAVEQGIDPETALKLAAKSMEGAALMLLRSGKTPAELTAQVTSPGGTTLAALAEMQRLGFSDAIRSGMLACTRRAFELGR